MPLIQLLLDFKNAAFGLIGSWMKKKRNLNVGVDRVELRSKRALYHSQPAVSSPQIKRLITLSGTMSRHEGHYIPAAGDLMRPPAAWSIQERPCGQRLQSAGAFLIYLFIFPLLPSNQYLHIPESGRFVPRLISLSIHAGNDLINSVVDSFSAEWILTFCH